MNIGSSRAATAQERHFTDTVLSVGDCISLTSWTFFSTAILTLLYCVGNLVDNEIFCCLK
jgi:hypothetical protein